MLAAGIDVFSTVNVQHLESLNDQVAELTGVRVRETVPDAVLARRRRGRAGRPHAEALIERLRARQGLPARARAGRAQRLLQGSRTSQALREVALRQVAEDVEAKRLVREPPATATRRCSARPRRRRSASGCSRSSRPQPSSQRVVRRAWRSAQRLGAELDVLVVRAARARTRRRASASSSTRCAGSRSVLGAHLLVEEGDDVAEVVARVARERGTTYVLMGAPAARRGLGRLRASRCRAAAAARCPASTCAIVADRSERDGSPSQ